MDSFKRSKKNKGKSATVSPPQSRPSTPGSSMKPAGGKPDKKAILEKGQETLEAASKVLDILEDLGDTAPFLAPMKVVCGLLNDAVKRAVLVEQNDEELQGLSEELLQQLKHIEKYAKDLSDPKFNQFMEDAKEPLDAYMKDLNELIETLTNMQARYESGVKNYAKRFLKASSDQGQIQSCRDKLKKSFDQFTHALVEFIAHQTMFIRAKVGEVHAGVEDVKAVVDAIDAKADEGRADDAINQLPYAIPSKQHGTCLEGTRQKIIKEIADWATDPNAVPIFALVDQAGTGKSTLATHMMEMWDKRNTDGSMDSTGGGMLMARFYFCKPGTVTGEKVASTLATDIANRFPSLRPLIQQALQKVKPVAACSFQRQLEEIVFAPLRSLGGTYIMAIDALDECSEEDRCIFLDSVSKFLASYPNGVAPLKFFLTCRPEIDIVSWIQKQTATGLARRVGFSLHAEGSRSNQDDIRLYTITYLPMLTPEQTELFITRANELFIWVTTAREFLNKAKNFKARFQTLMSSNSKKSPLDDLYSEILNAAMAGYEEEEEMDLRKVLQAICVAKEPLTITAMDELLHLEGGIADAIVKSLSSVLSDGAQDQPVHVLHPTFLEHLQNSSNPGPIFIANDEAECLVTRGCLASLCGGLKYDICGILQPNTAAPMNEEVEDLKQRLKERTTPALRYATTHALSHVTSCLGDEEIIGRLHIFFKSKLLEWIELVSFLGKVYSVIQAVHNLKSRIEEVLKSSNNIMLLDGQEWCEETLKLIQPYQAIIKASAMQVYFSALAFFPPTTRISKCHTLPLQQCIPRVLFQRTPSTDSKVLAGHQSAVDSFAFSSDGQRITSIDQRGKVRRWDVVTGGCVEELKVDNLHHSFLRHVVIPPLTDGTLATVVEDRSIALRNLRTGATLWEVQCEVDTEQPTDALISDACVFFSLDGKSLASYHGTVMQIWDVATGKESWRMKVESGIRHLAISPDSKLLANVDGYWVVRVWDIATGKSTVLPNPLDHHCSFPVVHDNPFLSFSSDGTILASSSLTHGIRLWYLEDREAVHYRDIANIQPSGFLAFSPSSQLLAYASRNTIHLYDVASKKAVGEPLTGHTDRIKSLVFSSNGRTLASGSRDNTVRIWELTVTEAVEQPRLEQVEPKGEVTSLAFSFDGHQFASGYSGGEVCLWDVEAGKVKWQVTGDKNASQSLSFSSDGRILASGHSHGNVMFWDVASGEVIGSVVGRGGQVNYLVFSSDSRLVATGGYTTKDAVVWQVPSGEMVAKRHADVDWIDSMSFHLHQGNNFLTINKKYIWDIYADLLCNCNDENAPFKLVDSYSNTATFQKPWVSVGESFTCALPPHIDCYKDDYKKGKFACGGDDGVELIVDFSHLM